MTGNAQRDRIVIDTNVMVGAAMGRSLPIIVAVASRAALMIPWPQVIEARRVIERNERSGDGVMQSLLAIVEPLASAIFEPLEQVARKRLHERGQSDWPVLAAALALDADIWSRDRDFFGVGVPVWETRNIVYAAAETAETEYHA